MLRSIGSVTFLALLMVGCGGGNSGSSPPPPPQPTYSIGGTVTGLSGSGLLLQTNSGDVVPVPKAGAFRFTNQLVGGAAYTVTVKTQPSTPAQNCVVTNGSGTVGTANVTTVAVACSTVANYTVGGTVSGLVGSGLTLAVCHVQINGPGLHLPDCKNQKQVSVDGTYTLDAVYPWNYSGADYVSIAQQPSSPTQNCTISNAAISTQAANDTGFTVSCAEFAFITNAVDNTLSTYRIDATTGAMQAVGTPTPTGKSPNATVAVETFQSGVLAFMYPRQYVVFVGNEDSNDVSAFAVNSATGALTKVPGSPFAAGGTDPIAMAAYWHGGNYNLYVANAGSHNLSAYSIDQGTGALAPLSPGPSTIATRNNPTSVVVAPSASVVYVANHGGSNDISAFSTDLTEVSGSPFPAGGNPLSLAVGGGGKFLYSANPDATNPSISGFSIDPTSGALSPLSGSPFKLPVSQYMATDQTGSYLYFTSGASVVGYGIDPTTGALTKLAEFPVATEANAYSVSVDPTNRFLYVTNDGAANVSGFTLDASTGALTPMAGPPFPAGHDPKFIATLFPAQF
ncbi:MAG TPA: beta-propeller fold lactonase family protein [Steroidobacteraceae bacterium]|jgi:6-phosphogluconolactonase|nr:beta-propeller fold lactonase family protein [Steroidobacteraceae bacterium]